MRCSLFGISVCLVLGANVQCAFAGQDLTTTLMNANRTRWQRLTGQRYERLGLSGVIGIVDKKGQYTGHAANMEELRRRLPGAQYYYNANPFESELSQGDIIRSAKAGGMGVVIAAIGIGAVVHELLSSPQAMASEVNPGDVPASSTLEGKSDHSLLLSEPAPTELLSGGSAAGQMK